MIEVLRATVELIVEQIVELQRPLDSEVLGLDGSSKEVKPEADDEKRKLKSANLAELNALKAIKAQLELELERYQ